MFEGRRVLVVVPARGGSKGVKLKNLREVGGVPLVALAGHVAKALPWVDRAIVSTDHEGIARVAEEAGLEIVRATGAYSFLIPPAWVKSKLERHRSSSDLDSNTSGVLGLLGLLAWCERLLLRYTWMPVGLSVVVIGRKQQTPPHTREWRP